MVCTASAAIVAISTIITMIVIGEAYAKTGVVLDCKSTKKTR